MSATTAVSAPASRRHPDLDCPLLEHDVARGPFLEEAVRQGFVSDADREPTTVPAE